MTDLSKSINRVKEFRKKRGMTQEQVASHIGCNQAVLQKIESGATKLNTEWMRKLAIVFDCEPWQLLPLDMFEFLEEYPIDREYSIMRLYNDINLVKKGLFEVETNLMNLILSTSLKGRSK